MDHLFNTLSDVDVQKRLLYLYSLSESECTRNGKLGMEIGMAREKDLIAVLTYSMGFAVKSDIDNAETRDMEVHGLNVSIKHLSNKMGTPVKIKWTSADSAVEKDVHELINGSDDSYPNLLIVYIHDNTIKIVCISSETNKNVIKRLQRNAFLIRSGNSRGIEYSKDAMKELIEKKSFEITISNANLKNTIDPIKRRLKLLESFG